MLTHLQINVQNICKRHDGCIIFVLKLWRYVMCKFRIQVLCLLWNAISRLLVWLTPSAISQLCVSSDMLLLMKYSLLTCLCEFSASDYQIPYWYITTLVYINKAEGPVYALHAQGHFMPVAPVCLTFVNYIVSCKTYLRRGIFVKWHLI